MPLGWFAQLAIGLAISIVAYIIMPKPKMPKPPEAEDQKDPTATGGTPVNVLQGTMTISGPNILWSGDKSKATTKVKVGGGKK